jgi:beta-aspartyl-peptidase (threonine type)
VIAICNNEGACGIAATGTALARGDAALDAIEAGIRLVEASEEVRTVGRGGWPNLLGEVELDASVMDGTTLRSGSVGSLTGYLHPVSIARQVLERLPHELLVGEGARRFAAEIGAEAGELLMPHARTAWERWFRTEVSAVEQASWPDVPMAELCQQAIDPEIGRDTTVFLAQDAEGHIGAGTSTSGWGWKYPGRLGDSPIIGAGSYADSRYGACACTGVGEMSIRAGTSRAVVLYMKMGMSVEEAVHEAVEDMRALKGGLIGRVTIHAIDRQGGHKVVAVNGLPENHYWLWRAGDAAPSSHPCEIIAISDVPAPKPTAHRRYEQMGL